METTTSEEYVYRNQLMNAAANELVALPRRTQIITLADERSSTVGAKYHKTFTHATPRIFVVFQS
jgi:hypothetical protein